MSFFMASPAAKRSEQGSANLASPHFTTAETPRACTTVELTIRDLGFPHGRSPLRSTRKPPRSASVSARSNSVPISVCTIGSSPQDIGGSPCANSKCPVARSPSPRSPSPQGRSPLTMTFPKAFTCAASRANCGCAAIGLGLTMCGCRMIICSFA